MAITLNSYTFDPRFTSVREDHQESAGQDGRSIRISGVLQGLEDVAAIEAALDQVLSAASGDETAVLSIRPDRQLRVRREKFTREVQRDGLIGRFELVLRAEDPFEQSASLHIWPWSVTASGATRALSSAGDAPSPLVLIVQANATLIAPSISDGARAITYDGALTAGTVLEIDGALRQARIDGADVTPYVLGEFPVLVPGANTLTYTDDDASSHNALIAIWYHERWW
jgi:phage-related protein